MDIWKWSLCVEAFIYLPNHFGSKILSLPNYLWNYNTEWERIEYSKTMSQCANMPIKQWLSLGG